MVGGFMIAGSKAPFTMNARRVFYVSRLILVVGQAPPTTSDDDRASQAVGDNWALRPMVEQNVVSADVSVNVGRRRATSGERRPTSVDRRPMISDTSADENRSKWLERPIRSSYVWQQRMRDASDYPIVYM